MAEVILTKENFEREVLRSDLPVLIDFWAPWCGPCRALAPRLEKLARDYEGRAKIAKVNADEQPELADAFHVMTIPALFVVRDGKVTKRAVGLQPRAELEKLLA